MRIWKVQQQQRREAAQRKAKQFSSDNVLSPTSSLILSMTHLVGSCYSYNGRLISVQDLIKAELPTSSSSAPNLEAMEIVEHVGEGRKPPGFKVKANQTSKCTPEHRLWKSGYVVHKNKVKMTLALGIECYFSGA